MGSSLHLQQPLVLYIDQIKLEKVYVYVGGGGFSLYEIYKGITLMVIQKKLFPQHGYELYSLGGLGSPTF